MGGAAKIVAPRSLAVLDFWILISGVSVVAIEAPDLLTFLGNH
jgi:hypothetical protein